MRTPFYDCRTLPRALRLPASQRQEEGPQMRRFALMIDLLSASGCLILVDHGLAAKGATHAN